MNILLLAPHPFYQERGTPIAVHLLLRVLSARGDVVDVLTYHEGADVSLPNVTIHRIPKLPGVSRIPPGLSLKKIVCDIAMAAKALGMAGRKRYDLVHAVEESVFMAKVIRVFFGIPYVYDMDSSMPQQIMDKFPALRWLGRLMAWRESRAIRHALAVVPMCDALADLARGEGARQVTVLRDVTLVEAEAPQERAPLRRELGIDGVCFMYIGNLESYQGIDLLLDSFRTLADRNAMVHLVIAGGAATDIARYTARAGKLGIASRVRFMGPQPVARMAALFAAADVLVSPRLKGANTPMKVYSYLGSGKAVLATDLPTHTQVLNSDVAVLAPPEPAAFAAAMQRLATDTDLRHRLGAAARALAQRDYSFATFQRTVNDLYAWLDTQVGRA